MSHSIMYTHSCPHCLCCDQDTLLLVLAGCEGVVCRVKLWQVLNAKRLVRFEKRRRRTIFSYERR